MRICTKIVSLIILTIFFLVLQATNDSQASPLESTAYQQNVNTHETTAEESEKI